MSKIQLSPTKIKGLVNCCNKPNIGYHPWYGEGEGTIHCSTLICSHCGYKKGVMGGNELIVAQYWNESFTSQGNPQPETDMPEWYFAKLNFVAYGLGSTKKIVELPFVIFKTDNKKYLYEDKDGFDCVINEARQLDDIEIMNAETGESIKLTEGKPTKSRPFSIHVSKGWCTDGTAMSTLNIRTYNGKWRSMFEKRLKQIFEWR